MPRKQKSRPQSSKSKSQSTLLRNLLILLGAVSLAWIAYSLLPKSSDSDIRLFIITIIGAVLAGIVILIVEYSYFQSTEKKSAVRFSKGGTVEPKKTPLFDFLKFLIENRSKTESQFVTPNWNRAQQIALNDLKKTLEKYDWQKADLSIVKFVAKKSLAYLVVEVFDTTYAKPVKIDSHILIISKLGDIQSREPYSVELAEEFDLI